MYLGRKTKQLRINLILGIEPGSLGTEYDTYLKV